MSEAVKKLVPMQAVPQTNPVIYTSSEIKSGLWKVETCLKNGQGCTSGDVLLRLFVLNGDAAKALEASQAVVGTASKILDTAKFTLVASKPLMNSDGTTQETAQRIRHELTGAEVKARAAAIIALAQSEKTPTILFTSPKKPNQGSGKSKNLAAGLAE